ncbi:MAG: hypothetical protein QF524_05085, partial [Planctomycetota bacterium]|nr:hypothetical protein [Planctomycetota bacterium]
AGAWFSCVHPEKGEIKLGQGKESVRQILRDNPDLREELRGLITLAMAPQEEVQPSNPKDKKEAKGAKGKVAQKT